MKIVEWGGKVTDAYTLLKNKSAFLTEEEFDGKFWQAVNDEKERQQKERQDRLLAYIDKYGIDIGVTIIKIEDGEIKEPWWWFGDKMTFLQMTYERYGADITNDILRGVVKLGYTAQVCELAWGEADRVNKTTHSLGTHEQWVYRAKNAYLYFEDGILKTIQE